MFAYDLVVVVSCCWYVMCDDTHEMYDVFTYACVVDTGGEEGEEMRRERTEGGEKSVTGLCMCVVIGTEARV